MALKWLCVDICNIQYPKPGYGKKSSCSKLFAFLIIYYLKFVWQTLDKKELFKEIDARYGRF